MHAIQFAVQFLSDEEMASGHDFAFVETPCRVLLLIRESALTPRTITDALTAYHAIEEESQQRPVVMRLVTQTSYRSGVGALGARQSY